MGGAIGFQIERVAYRTGREVSFEARFVRTTGCLRTCRDYQEKKSESVEEVGHVG